MVDVYNGEDGNAISVRLFCGCCDRTLTREEVQTVVDGIIAALAEKNVCLK